MWCVLLESQQLVRSFTVLPLQAYFRSSFKDVILLNLQFRQGGVVGVIRELALLRSFTVLPFTSSFQDKVKRCYIVKCVVQVYFWHTRLIQTCIRNTCMNPELYDHSFLARGSCLFFQLTKCYMIFVRKSNNLRHTWNIQSVYTRYTVH